MSTPLLYHVLFAWKCSSTHHKLALDALRHLRHERSEAVYNTGGWPPPEARLRL